MSFSSDCKGELCRLPPGRPCCMIAELSALYMSLGSLHLLGRGQMKLTFSTESAAVARRIFLLLQKGLSLTSQVYKTTNPRFGGLQRYVLTLSPTQVPILLTRLSMLDLNIHGEAKLKSTSPRISLSRSCCARSFLRGAMLGCGAVSESGSGYHLDFILRDDALRSFLTKCLRKFDLPIQQSRRKDTALLFLSQGEQIVTLLTLMGAHQAVMALEDLRIRRELMGNLNRAMNCDTANLQKLVNASHSQISQIERLMQSGTFKSLPLSLQEIAEVRLRAPDASLTDLGAMLNPPLGKSGVNHRMRRLMEIAREETGDGDD